MLGVLERLNRRVLLAVLFLIGAGAVAAVWPDAQWRPSAHRASAAPTSAPVGGATSPAELRARLASFDPTTLQGLAVYMPDLFLITQLRSRGQLPGYELSSTAYGLTPAAAALFNAALPIADEANPAAAAFSLAGAVEPDRKRAHDCLTAAVYYEAATEGLEGQRAVAQVVLNRVRDPAYPKTVCGVVFQGSERATGCQFTFTCDGALARAPNPRLWKQAQDVAAAALAGRVEARVGHATHYHTFWVAPYWAPELTKVARIGAHIFYRWPGARGLGLYGGAYAGGEILPDTYAIGDEPPIETTMVQTIAYEPEILPATVSLQPQDGSAAASALPAANGADDSNMDIALIAPPVMVAPPPERPARPARLPMPSTW